jgi:hypothetical protein
MRTEIVVILKKLITYQKHSMVSHKWQAISCLNTNCNKKGDMNSCSRLAEVTYQLSYHNISASIQELWHNTLRII